MPGEGREMQGNAQANKQSTIKLFFIWVQEAALKPVLTNRPCRAKHQIINYN